MRLPRAIARFTAVNALQRIGPRTDRAVDALIPVVARDPVSTVRGEAISVLGTMGSAAKRAVPTLEPLLIDPYLGGTAPPLRVRPTSSATSPCVVSTRRG